MKVLHETFSILFCLTILLVSILYNLIVSLSLVTWLPSIGLSVSCWFANRALCIDMGLLFRDGYGGWRGVPATPSLTGSRARGNDCWEASTTVGASKQHVCGVAQHTYEVAFWIPWARGGYSWRWDFEMVSQQAWRDWWRGTPPLWFAPGCAAHGIGKLVSMV